MGQLSIFEDIDPGTAPGPLVEIPEAAKQESASVMSIARQILQVVTDAEGGGEDGEGEAEALFARVQRLHELDQAVFWAIGDEILKCIPRVGKMRAFRLAGWAMGLSPRWAMEMAKVSKIFPPEKRYMGVKWNVYRACSTSKDPHSVLERSIGYGWDARKARSYIRSLES